MSDKTLDLMEVGTRWQHYAELLDLFSAGAEVMANLSVKSTTDDLKRRKLQAACEMIATRINVLSGFEDAFKWGPLRRLMDDEIEPMLFTLREKMLHDKANEDSKGTEAHPST